MKLWHTIRAFLLAFLLALGTSSPLVMSGCEDEAPAEETGEEIDEAADEVGDELD